jgi:hypothetical protein
MNAACDLQGHVIIHGPNREAQAIPAEISEAAQRLQLPMSSDVGALKFGIAEKAELGGDVTDLTDFVLQNLTEFFLALAMHEHDAIHELHAVLFTGCEDFQNLPGITTHGLFDEHMLASLCRTNDPFFAQTCGQRDVNGVDVGTGIQR